MKINCIVVDDQPASLEMIGDYIKQIPALNLKYSSSNPIEALGFLEREGHKIDCVFLDIQMPRLNGLEFIETVKERGGKEVPYFVLVTSYGEYAVRSYDFGVLDYVTKPVSFKRFKIATDRLIEKFQPRQVSSIPSNSFFFVEVDGQKLKINFEDISMIEARGNYVELCVNGKKLSIYSSLSNIQTKLPSHDFIRVHKSFIVSKNYIEALIKDEIIIKEANVRKVPIGAKFKESVLKNLKIS